jgi:hypothetical protein
LAENSRHFGLIERTASDIQPRVEKALPEKSISLKRERLMLGARMSSSATLRKWAESVKENLEANSRFALNADEDVRALSIRH